MVGPGWVSRGSEGMSPVTTLSSVRGRERPSKALGFLTTSVTYSEGSSSCFDCFSRKTETHSVCPERVGKAPRAMGGPCPGPAAAASSGRAARPLPAGRTARVGPRVPHGFLDPGWPPAFLPLEARTQRVQGAGWLARSCPEKLGRWQVARGPGLLERGPPGAAPRPA